MTADQIAALAAHAIAEEIAGKISRRFFLQFSFAVDLYTRGEEWTKQGPYLTALRHRVAVNGVIT